VEETKGEEKDKMVDNNEIDHICIGIRHEETQGWGKRAKKCSRGRLH
jgi:hypothetical protein